MLSIASASTAPKISTDHPDAELIALGRTFDIIGAKLDKLDADNNYDDFRDNPAIGKLHDDLHAAAGDLGRRILSTPATTVEGLQVKARCALWCDCGLVEENLDGEFNDGTALASLVQDVLAMAAINPPTAPPAILSAPAAANHNAADAREAAAA